MNTVSKSQKLLFSLSLYQLPSPSSKGPRQTSQTSRMCGVLSRVLHIDHSCLHIKYTHYVYALAKLPLTEKQLAMGRIYWAKFQYTVSIQYSQKDTNLLANQLLLLRTGRQCHENANRKQRRSSLTRQIIRFLCQHLKHLTFSALTLSYFLIGPIAGIKRFIKMPHNWLGKQRVKWEMRNVN